MSVPPIPESASLCRYRRRSSRRPNPANTFSASLKTSASSGCARMKQTCSCNRRTWATVFKRARPSWRSRTILPSDQPGPKSSRVASRRARRVAADGIKGRSGFRGTKLDPTGSVGSNVCPDPGFGSADCSPGVVVRAKNRPATLAVRLTRGCRQLESLHVAPGRSISQVAAAHGAVSAAALHVDVSVSRDHLRGRLAAALAAGGRVVWESEEHWTPIGPGSASASPPGPDGATRALPGQSRLIAESSRPNRGWQNPARRRGDPQDPRLSGEGRCLNAFALRSGGDAATTGSQ